MTKDLERDLGLPAVVAVAMGAMIGSGIFILPGVAMAEAGPAVILAFLIAGVVVLPAALSISELATAMPEAGGDYVFIERGIGPAAGTIAGIGTWLTLLFKGALALFGGMFYVEFLLIAAAQIDLTILQLTAIAVAVTVLLTTVNVVGVKQTGTLQTWMVTLMIVLLGGFVAVAITEVQSANYEPFFSEGYSGVAVATATVVVSYAGVTKVAAIAEEVENPGRNLPLGLLVSLVVTAFLYALLVFVLVGTVDAGDLSGELAPVAVAVEPLLGLIGVVAIVLAAILALVSTANAGILTSSRYPLALSRDDLLPGWIGEIHPRYNTPMRAILGTGLATIVVIVAFDVQEIAKLASAFQVLVYTLVNVALIAFRERDLEWYDPEFESPLYPWMPLFGVVAGIGVIAAMDFEVQIGAVVIITLGFLWYMWYGRPRVDREGVAVDAIRRQAGRRAVEDTRERLDRDGYQVLVAIQEGSEPARESDLVRVAAPLVRERGGTIHAVRFEEVPDQTPLGEAVESTDLDRAFEARMSGLSRTLDVEIRADEIVSHDTRHAVVNYADRIDADLMLGERDAPGRLGTLFGNDTDWIVDHADCDVVFVQNQGFEGIDEIAVITDRSPFNDPLKVKLANSMATVADARLRILFSVAEDAPDSLITSIEDYHDELDDLCTVPVESELIRADDAVGGLGTAASSADVVFLSTEPHRITDAVFERRTDQLAALLDRTTLLVHSEHSRQHSFLKPILDRVLFRGTR